METDKKMSRTEYYNYMVGNGVYSVSDRDYDIYAQRFNQRFVSNNDNVNNLASDAASAGIKNGISKELNSLKGEYFDTSAMSGTYEQLVAQVDAFCEINRNSKQVFEDSMRGITDGALVGLPAATATKSWGDNMGAMDDLEEALRAYADAEQAIINDNIKTDNEMRDTFAAVSKN